MQPYLFPYIGYFQLMGAVDKFVLLDDVNFINKGWINRNRILVNGKDYMFTVPLRDASQNRFIRDIEIANDGKWGGKLMKTIEMNYRRAPYFEPAGAIISEIIHSNFETISSKIFFSLSKLTHYFGLTTDIVESSSIYHIEEAKGEDRILEICRLEKASHYINLIGGKELYSADRFRAMDVQLSFLRAKLVPYEQGGVPFVPGLSIVDVMMFNSPERIRAMLLDYELE